MEPEKNTGQKIKLFYSFVRNLKKKSQASKISNINCRLNTATGNM